MIVFVTLFLGLVRGPQVVEVAVADSVAAVELHLDGEPAGRLEGEPWKATVDLGDELSTHELVAVALDGAGREVGRAAQQVNVPRPPTEVEILLADWERGRPRHARLVWRSSDLVAPSSIAVSLDGLALEAADPQRIELPEVDPGSLHFITAELAFPGNRRARTQAVFGGHYGAEVSSELTAVPVVPGGRPLERPEEARGWLRGPGGEPLRVVAVEDEAAELLIVRDEAALPALRRLGRKLTRKQPRTHKSLRPAREDLLYLMSARPMLAAHPELDYELFPVSSAFGLRNTSLPEALAFSSFGREPDSEQRLADAVVVAGVRAAAAGRRRAVLLVVEDCAAANGLLSGEAARRFLFELRVPLEVWTTGRSDGQAGGFCRGAIHLKATGKYLRALARLRRLLEKQRVLWVEGRHLPRQIALADAAAAREVVQAN